MKMKKTHSQLLNLQSIYQIQSKVELLSFLKIIKFQLLLLSFHQSLVLLLPNDCWVLKKHGNKAYPSFAGQPERLSSHRKDALRHETVPGLITFHCSSIPILDGEDGGLRYPKESIKLLYELGRLLGVFQSVLRVL